LSLLANIESSYLTRKLRIPSELEPDQLDQLVSFILRVGNANFDDVMISLEDLHKIHGKVGVPVSSVWLRSLRYVLYVDDQRRYNLDAWFPEFTTEVEMEHGTIRNIPSALVKLDLEDVVISKSMMETISEAKFMTSLRIADGARDIVLCGFPQYLERLEIRTRSDIRYTEGYSYDCERLRCLDLGWGRGFTDLPEDLVTSMSKSLTHLDLKGSPKADKSYLKRLLWKLERLQNLSMHGFDMEDGTIPPWIRILTLKKQDFRTSLPYDREWTPLPNLTELTIPFYTPMQPFLEASPNLKKLTILSDFECWLEDLGETKVEILEIHNYSQGDEFMPIPFERILETFTSIKKYTYTNANPHLELTVDHTEKNTSLHISSITSSPQSRAHPSEPFNGTISLLGTDCEKHDITFHPSRIQYDCKFEILLPLTTKEIKITIIRRGEQPHTKTYTTETLQHNSGIHQIGSITITGEYTETTIEANIALLPMPYLEKV